MSPGDKDRERVQLAIEEGRKRERRDAGVKHRRRDQDGALYAPEEDDRKEEDKDKAYAEREYGIVRHVVHFLEALVGALDRKAGGNRISLRAEIGKEGIRAGKDMCHELVVGRGPDEFRVHHAVEKDLSGAVRARAPDKARLQMVGNGLLLVPFFGLARLHRSLFLVLLEEAVECADRLVGETQFLRQVGIEPHAFLLGRSSGIRIPGSRLVFEQVDNQRAVLAPDFELQVFEVVADMFKMLDRQIKERIVLEELVLVVHLGRDEIALPVLMDIGADGILQGGNQFGVLALDGYHEAVSRTEPLVGFLEGLHAGRIFGQQVREVGIEFEPRLEQDRDCQNDGQNQVKGERLVLVPANQGDIPIGKTFYQ